MAGPPLSTHLLRSSASVRKVAEISETGGECLFVTLDVVNEGHWKEAVEATVQRFGKLDVLVNNAGIFKLANVEETSSEL